MQKPISAGTVVSHRYQVQKKIHDNTFNSCYLAEDTEHSNRLVMISIPRIELLILPDFAPTFAEVCKKLMVTSVHGLLKVLGNGEHDSQPYAVLQYVTDETLEHVLERKRASSSKVNLESVLDWATPLAVTLDELHEFNYIHGGLKPSGVYIGSQQILMGDFITEFSLQKIGKLKRGITTLNVDNYLSPEYLKSTYTAHYDQYLLATMVYEALAGKVPFARSKGGDDYRMQVATHVSPLLTAHRPELKAVSDVLAKAMKRKPTDRYKSCRNFISELQEAQAAAPAKPPPQKRVVITTPFSDDPEEDEEEIITSIRKNQQRSSGKKSWLWLGVLLLAGGAAAFTAVQYPGVLGLSESQVKNEDSVPVVVPVAIAPVSVPEKVSVDESSTTADKTPAAVVTSAEVESTSVQSQFPNDETLINLNNVVNQALNAGQATFEESQQAEANQAATYALLDNRLTDALLKGQDDFVKQAAAEALVDPASPTANGSETNSDEGISTQTAEESTIAWSDPASSEAAEVATEVSVTPEPKIEVAVDPAKAMQKERERIQALKREKLARIKSITDDCSTGGKIHRETAAGNLAYVKKCLSVGVDANATQSNGWTLLHIAARSGSLNLCKLLIAKGATVNAKANNNQTPLDMAIEFRQDKVVSYLKTRGASG